MKAFFILMTLFVLLICTRGQGYCIDMKEVGELLVEVSAECMKQYGTHLERKGSERSVQRETSAKDAQELKLKGKLFQASAALMQQLYKPGKVEITEWWKNPYNYYHRYGQVSSPLLRTVLDHSHSFSDLRTTMYNVAKIKAYRLDIFDCSERSAYYEYVLENFGYDTHIIVGRPPWNPYSQGAHAWLIVKIQNQWAAIECTDERLTKYRYEWSAQATKWLIDAPGIVLYNPRNLVSVRYYRGRAYRFENIYQAMARTRPDEWDWWNVR